METYLVRYCVENTDVLILITMQKRKKDGKLFLSFLMCKNRYKESELKFFNQPFDEKTFNLEDDVLLKKPKGLVSLSTDFEDVDLDLYEKKGRNKHMLDDGKGKVVDDIFSLSPLS